MRTLILFACLIVSLTSAAQYYSCLQTGVKPYYINGNGYLRGIRVDSTKTVGDTTWYFLFHTPRGKSTYPAVLDSTGGSWVGKKVKSTGDGTFVFDNWIDTVFIKSQAGLGESWDFYTDSSNLGYTATVISLDTMSAAGFTDSVKIIEITAHNPSGPVVSDSLNGFKIILSKNHGFLQVFDLYTFPYHKPDSSYHSGMDFYLDRSTAGPSSAYGPAGQPPQRSISIFRFVDFINPTNRQLYDFSIGDVYQFKECLMSDGFACDFSYMGEPSTSSFVETDTVVSKTVGSGTTVYDFTGPRSGPNPFYLLGGGSSVLTANDAVLIDTALMPEEFKQKNMYYYYPFGNTHCFVSAEYTIVPNYLGGGAIAPFYFEGPVYQTVYKLGLGQVYYYTKSTGFTYFSVYSSELIYFKNSDATCGTPVKVKHLTTANDVAIYPNPVTDVLNIEARQPIEKVAIMDMAGRLLYQSKYSSTEITVDVHELSTGTYLLRVNDGIVRRFTKL